VVAAAALLLAACGGSSSGGTTTATSAAAQKPPSVPMLDAVGTGEGTLNLIAWAGYAEDGTTDPKVDWVTPFEKASGCQVNVKTGNTSDEMVTLMKTGQYDGVSASGDATLRLIYGGDVAPVNTALVSSYADITGFLKDRPWNSVDGQMYGIPHGWGANVLLYNKAVVTTPPDSWGVVFDAASPYKGKVSAYDSPIYIADAALYLKATQPDLKITNPYELDQKQFDAAVALLKTQRGIVGEYWSDYTKATASIESGNTVLTTSWQVIANLVTANKKVEIGTVLPKEGATGWSDTWMVSSKAKNPNCMYKWLDWIAGPTAQAAVGEWFGEAPANGKACAVTSDKAHCETYHATDAAYAERIAYWTTPVAACGDERGNTCKDYSAWTQAWTGIKG
jgi:putative spermidine/putrescine transport system substrate-binding protein